MPPTILLTGATGFLGGALSPSLATLGNLVPQGRSRCPSGGVQADLADPDALRDLLRQVRPDIVVHAAAVREPDVCEADPEGTGGLNARAPRLLAETLPESARLLFISSDYVFDGRHPPFVETDPVSPVNVYGKQKVRAEAAVLEHPGGLVLRVPVLVGAGPGFIAQMIEAVRSGEEQEVDDVLVRHPTWTRDVAAVCGWLLRTRKTGIWQASSRKGGTRFELTRRLADFMGLPWSHLTPSRTVVPRRAERPLNSQLSPEKLEGAGGPVCHELEEVLAAMREAGEL